SFDNDYGVGIFFLPSGVAYFNNIQGSIPAYSPIIFRVNLFLAKRADHDRDGVLSINEIEYGDFGVITFPDSNGNLVPDYLDSTFPGN
ncbi:MAG: hypothetical protein H0X63_07655, partial [Flavobacteriales bacterium]|nr:hypothetical protein [Flavobacteriales bacterium]